MSDLQDLKEEIRARNDIVEVVSQYMRLQKAGKNWKGLCPFHNDKNPSFSVIPQLQIYKCFSCGEAGDVFKFVQKKENLEFVEAMEFLARRAGIPFERKGVSPERASEREQMFELNNLAARFFQDRLAKSPEVQSYLAQRGILKETQERFQIGSAPDDWEALTFYLQRHRVDLVLAAKTGLIRAREQGGGYMDFFRNRLMLPIHDVSGRVVAFGGRALGDHPAKYMNSEQSILFDKSRTLYGLYFARKKLSGEIPAVFVEGYLDVITAHQAGFTQCVATLGTAMTEEHARILARYNPRVVICYDGDAAGIKATLRGAQVWEGIGVEGAEVRVARLPEGDDPDSLLRRGETAAFQAALDNAVPRVDFQVELAMKRHDIHTEAGRDAALAEVIPILASIRSLSMRDRFAQRLAFLHPLHDINARRAIEAILADAEMHARSARDQGYPLTEAANRRPLAETPPPPTYRPPNSRQWGEWPMTQNVVRKGEGWPGGEAGRGYDRRDKRRAPAGPVGDPTPPPLETPALTGAEKTERQLLRALFSPEWRLFILSRLQPDGLVTPQGRQLFACIARTPAASDGGVDPLPLLRQIEAEEEEAPASEEETAGADADANSNQNSAKLSIFLRHILEDSPYLVSNELLNEAAVTDCLKRLQQHRDRQLQRELAAILQNEALTPEQRRAAIQQYHQRVREARGSPPSEEEA
ncbi:MAG TPA: DNA primase [Chthonomonadaceae bacterium]|nr:DNA primase [Chthonomonadaceae bacterium]